MSDKRINVCLACDDNYAEHAGVVTASVLANANEDDELNIYILDGGITEKHKQEILSLKSIKDCNIIFVEIDSALFEDYKKIQTHSYITLATYYRLKLASLLPDTDRIIYFDCDMVINSSLRDLFNTDIDNYLIAGAKDINKRILKKNPNYVNAGMILFNLTQIRKEGVENQFLLWSSQNIDKIKMGDQEIINEVCKNRIKIVDDKWNVQSSNFTNRSSYTNNPNVIHFVARKKPWHWASFSYHRDLYFKYLQLTPWKLSDEDYRKWTKNNQIASLIAYIKYRPFFMFRPRFYKALFQTYFSKLFTSEKKHSADCICAESDKQHNIIIFNTACFGDVLLCNSLCQNIKHLYPNSRVIFVVDKKWVDAAKYQKNVDEVLIYDKHGENKGFFGMLKFVKNFPYKKPYLSFVIYRNERNIVISKLIGAKHILFRDKKFTVTKQQEHANLLGKVTQKPIISYPIKYEASKELPLSLKNIIIPEENYIAVCLISKENAKDCPIETGTEIINKINAEGINNKNFKVIFCGASDKAKEYAEKLRQANCDFIDLTNKTTIPELASVLKNSSALISVDTGTMHFGYALDIPTVCLFYKEENAKYWAPDENLYKVKVLKNNLSTENIIRNTAEILKEFDNE